MEQFRRTFVPGAVAVMVLAAGVAGCTMKNSGEPAGRDADPAQRSGHGAAE